MCAFDSEDLSEDEVEDTQTEELKQASKPKRTNTTIDLSHRSQQEINKLYSTEVDLLLEQAAVIQANMHNYSEPSLVE